MLTISICVYIYTGVHTHIMLKIQESGTTKHQHEKKKKVNLAIDLTFFTKLTQIGHRPTCKTQKYKTPRIWHRRKSRKSLGLVMAFWYNSKRHDPRKRLNKLDFIKIKKLLLCKRHYQENEKTSHRPGENICKRHISLMSVIKNIQRTLKPQ